MTDSKNGLPDQFLVQLSYDRIGQLNKILFNHRVFFATIIGTVFASLQIVKITFANGVSTEYEIGLAAILVVGIFFIALIISAIIALLDFIHLDLVENCVVVIREAEAKNSRSDSSSIFNKPRQGATAVKMNVIVATFYLLPVWLLYGFIIVLTNMIINKQDQYPDYVVDFFESQCRSRESFDSDLPRNDVAISEICWSASQSFGFSGELQILILSIFVVSSVLVGVLSLNLFCRVIRRILLYNTLRLKKRESSDSPSLGVIGFFHSVRVILAKKVGLGDSNKNSAERMRKISDQTAVLLSEMQVLFVFLAFLSAILFIFIDAPRLWLVERLFH